VKTQTDRGTKKSDQVRSKIERYLTFLTVAKACGYDFCVKKGNNRIQFS